MATRRGHSHFANRPAFEFVHDASGDDVACELEPEWAGICRDVEEQDCRHAWGYRVVDPRRNESRAIHVAHTGKIRAEQDLLDFALADDAQENSRLGLTLSIPFGARHSLKLTYSEGATTRRGNDFESFMATWQHVRF